MTDPIRSGATRAAVPAVVRDRRRARAIVPAAATLAVGALAVTLFAATPQTSSNDAEAQSYDLVALANANQQSYQVSLVSGVEGAGTSGPTVNRDGEVTVTVETPEPEPVTTSGGGGGGGGNTYNYEHIDYDPASLKGQAEAMMASQYGWGADQMACLDRLWTRESGWNPNAYNSSSGATGIPQALPGSKMASHGADWATNPITQISWGLSYINDRYGSPCAAWASSESRGWY